jgi:S-methylmethionine-dependent homocysteine/selenocysteine methylase
MCGARKNNYIFLKKELKFLKKAPINLLGFETCTKINKPRQLPGGIGKL